jgi:plastocyanin domain-containing protein
MSGIEWMVLAGAVGGIAWVNWYFFVAGRSPAGAAVATVAHAGSGVPRLTIVVDGGYSPNTVRVRPGQPVRLVFDRRDASSCSEEVVFPDFGIRKYLPTGQKTTIELTPPRAGSFPFTCGMSMLRGTLIAEEQS